MTKPRSSHQAVYWALPGAHVRMSRSEDAREEVLGVRAR